MKIILKKHVDTYRYTVAKAVFLTIYREYSLIKDIKESNIMLVYDKEKQEDLIISMFGEPFVKKENKLIIEEYSIKVYYEKKSKGHYDKRVMETISKRRLYDLLNKEFDMLFTRLIEDAFRNTPSFIEEISDEYELFNQLFEYYFSEAEKVVCDYTERLFKYFSLDTVEKNKYKTNDGVISFSNPKYFNDPFDCNYYLSNNEDMRDRFRVLCLTSDYTNILMWSYYSNNHKGYCFGYKNNNILEQIKHKKIPGICVFGDVEYKPKRPDIKAPVSVFSYNDLKHYIDAAFTKYKKWEHEQECRFIIISKDTMQDFIHIKPNINDIYLGSEGEKSDIYNSSHKKMIATKIVKDSKEYKLILSMENNNLQF